MSGAETTAVAVLRGPDDARQVISEHLRSDAGGRCLGCGRLRHTTAPSTSTLGAR